jgi:hypothetical protein
MVDRNDAETTKTLYFQAKTMVSVERIELPTFGLRDRAPAERRDGPGQVMVGYYTLVDDVLTMTAARARQFANGHLCRENLGGAKPGDLPIEKASKFHFGDQSQGR